MAEPSQEIAAPSITRTRYTIDFSEIGMNDVAQMGGKNASRGQLFNVLRSLGVNVLDAFSTTATAYRQLLAVDHLEQKSCRIFADLDYDNVANLATCVHRTLTFHQGYSYLFH